MLDEFFTFNTDSAKAFGAHAWIVAVCVTVTANYVAYGVFE
jgi:hypothetical protein